MSLLRCNILLHPCESRIHGVGVEMVAADLDFAVQDHRHLVPPALLQLGVAVHVQHLDREIVPALELAEPRQELLAKMAVFARQDGELQSWSARNVMNRVPCSSRISIEIGFFTSTLATFALKVLASVTSWPLTIRIRSPGPMPAAWAAPSETSTCTPRVSLRVFFCSGVRSFTARPSLPGLASGFFALPALVSAAAAASSSLNSATVTVTSRILPLRHTARLILL